jgi:hypothetical protein
MKRCTPTHRESCKYTFSYQLRYTKQRSGLFGTCEGFNLQQKDGGAIYNHVFDLAGEVGAEGLLEAGAARGDAAAEAREAGVGV